MYYFDNKFLMHYINLNSNLKVYVDQEYYEITDAYDISDPNVGYGYTIYGEPRKFDYKEIQQIMVGDRVFTLDQLQSAYSAKEEEPKDSEKQDKSEEQPAEEPAAEETPEEPAEEEEPKKEEEPPAEEEEEKPQESVRIGSYIQNIDPTHSKFNTKGGVVLIENGYITYEYYSSEKGGMTQVSVRPQQIKPILY